MVSIIIPFYNERGNLGLLYEKLSSVLQEAGEPYELIFVDDGSTDGSSEVLTPLTQADSRLKLIIFRGNYGQTAAFMAGVDHSVGDIVIPIDADLQNDPKDIPAMLDKLKEGYDVVSGWRRSRKDKFLRSFLSRQANHLISRLWKLPLHDFGCSLKAYKRECLEGLRFYGEVHRFLPLIMHLQGASVAEVEVGHHPRHSGQSKYTLTRTVKVVLDLLTFAFMSNYFVKPNYIFGLCGLALFGCSGLSFLIVSYRVLVMDRVASTPMIFLWLFFSLAGLLFVLMGLLAEMITRLYFDTEGRKPYRIKQTIHCPELSEDNR